MPQPSSAHGVAQGPVNRYGSENEQLLQQDAQQRVDREALRKVVDQANAVMALSNESISFGYEEKLGRLYVQVTDKQTGDVIRQIPSKEFMQHQIAMREMIGLILDKQA